MKIVRSLRSQSAFTMVEIALCLAIVGFALVAIIGVLPTGLNVQKDNREETIINQEAAIWLDAIRSGSQGFDDLTNYVVAITNFWAGLDPDTLIPTGVKGYDVYTPLNSEVTSVSITGDCALTNGMRIIGLLSTPRYTHGFAQSNYIVAHVRAMSGAAVEKSPQNNPDVLRDAFKYRVIIENTPYLPFDTNTIDFAASGISEFEAAQRTNNAQLMQRFRDNSRDLRLTFRWPVLPNGRIGNGRQTYRQFIASPITNAVDFVSGQPLYFFQPSIVHQ